MRNAAVFISLALIIPTQALAGWSFTDNAVSTEKKTPLTNEAVEFTIGSMKCGASATRFQKHEDDSVSEYRELYCWTSKDTAVSIVVSCDLPRSSMQSMTIKKGEKTHMPALTCGPDVKTDK